jgi:pyruvate dehydrogenase E2 component (dihydrolipoamide acetyltransferase)
MATEVVMPKLGLTMEAGTIGSWLVEEGAPVTKGQPLLEIITDKVTMDVEAQVDGVLLKMLHAEGEEVAVSEVIGLIGSVGEDISGYAQDDGAVPKEEAPAVPAAVEQSASSQSQSTAIAESVTNQGKSPHRASPKARKMAAELGVNLGDIQGSGAGGRVVSADLEGLETAPRSVDEPVVDKVLNELPDMSGSGEPGFVPLNPAEKIAAQRLTESYQNTPHIHITMDVSAIWLEQFRQGYRLEGKKISVNDLIVQAAGRALRDFSRINSHYQPGGYVPMPEVHIGVAVAAEQGLVVPVVRNVDKKSVEEISAESARLVDLARRGGLGIDDMQGGTFTISNLGMFGVSKFTAIINPPQVAILAVGAIEKRVVALEGDAFAVRPQMTLTLAADHRVVDGALAARFLSRLREILETPGLLG